MSVTCNKCGSENTDTAKFCNGCGGGLQGYSPDGDLVHGTVLDCRYEIIDLLKKGGMGAVYAAKDRKFDTVCAIKELRPLPGTPQEKTTEWFKREAKLLNQLDHPNLPQVTDYFIYSGRYYLVMRFIEGEDLETILKREGKPGLSEDKIVEWAMQVLNVLDYLHNHKPPVIYRDLKPGNIMIHRDGRAMLIDFGIARVVQEASTTKKTAIGTIGYTPPEQVRGKPEPRSDLYALGATIHHLLTGIEPVGPGLFEPLKKIIPGISEAVDTVVTKALEIKAEDRHSNAKEMMKALIMQAASTSVQAIPLKQKASGLNNIPQTSPISPQVTKVQQVKPKSIKTCTKSELIFIPGGTFQMGSKEYDDDEKPVHSVTLDSFYMGKYPVTNKEYKLFKSGHKGKWSESDYPVEKVTWFDAVDYCNWLSDKEGFARCYKMREKPKSGIVSWFLGATETEYIFDIKKSGYRLPTEAEWEYACRAGTTTKYYWGDEMDGDYCWYEDNSNETVHTVGQRKPNAWGLYDMVGNVWEWCWDWHGEGYYSKSPSNNPTGPTGNVADSFRVLRGGSWYDLAVRCRSALRFSRWPDYGSDIYGFRLVRRMP